MVSVAIAGASTGLGAAVLNAFLTTPNNHKLIVLSRTANPTLTARGAIVREVDYTSPTSLVTALGGVHTVLSFIGGFDYEAMKRNQIALLDAAKDAGVKRFAPSEYAGIDNVSVDGYAPKEEVWQACLKSGLEVTKFACGLFMNILGTGTPKPATEGSMYESGGEEALGGLRAWNYVVNLKAGTADLPGKGEDEFVLTTTHDVGRFVLAALDTESWPQITGMRGDVVSFRRLVEIAGKVQGRKFLVKENSVEAMQHQIEDVPDTRFYNQTRIALTKGWMMVPDTLNKAFPDIKPTTAEDFVEKWWGGVTDLPEPAWEKPKIFAVGS